MFLARLQPSEKLSFLQLAAQLMQIDGNETATETALFAAMVNELRFPIEPAELEATFAEAVAGIRNRTSQRIALLELLSLAAVDNEVAPAEHFFVRMVAERFEVSPNELKAMANWVQEMMRLSQAGEALLG